MTIVYAINVEIELKYRQKTDHVGMKNNFLRNKLFIPLFLAEMVLNGIICIIFVEWLIGKV